MTHGYDASSITLVSDHNPSSPGTPASRGQDVFEKLSEAHQFAQTSMALTLQSQEKYANNSRDTAPTYKLGDLVWLNLKNINTERPSKKLDWIHAKYKITRTFPDSAHFYELDTPEGIHNKFHTSLLRPAHDDPLPSQKSDDSQPPGILTSTGDEEFGVDEILDSRNRKIGRGSRKRCL